MAIKVPKNYYHNFNTVLQMLMKLLIQIVIFISPILLILGAVTPANAELTCSEPNCLNSNDCSVFDDTCIQPAQIGRGPGECGLCSSFIDLINVTITPERKCPYPLCEPGSGGTQCNNTGVCYAPDPGQNIRAGCHVCRTDAYLQPINPDGCCDPRDPNSCIRIGYQGSCNISDSSCASGFACSYVGVRTDRRSVPFPPYDFCANAVDINDAGDCRKCIDKKGIWTAIGCIDTDMTLFITGLARFALGIGGGLALLIMLFGTFLLSTATGDPEKMQAGQQTITAAVAGLLAIIFSATILQFIGIDILQLPGLQ